MWASFSSNRFDYGGDDHASSWHGRKCFLARSIPGDSVDAMEGHDAQVEWQEAFTMSPGSPSVASADGQRCASLMTSRVRGAVRQQIGCGAIHTVTLLKACGGPCRSSTPRSVRRAASSIEVRGSMSQPAMVLLASRLPPQVRAACDVHRRADARLRLDIDS